MIGFKFNGEILEGESITKIFGTKGQLVEVDGQYVVLLKDVVAMDRLKYSSLRRQDLTSDILEIFWKGVRVFRKGGSTGELKSFVKNHRGLR